MTTTNGSNGTHTQPDTEAPQPARKPVLIVVDVQNGFVRRQSQHVVPVIEDLVERWLAAGGDTVFTKYVNHPGSLFERLIGWSQLMDSPQIDIVEELTPYAERATAVVDKHEYGLFNNAEGAALVAEHGWTDIYVCGIATESCVLATALGAWEAGLVPWVIQDASASHAGQETHDAGILVASRFIGKRQIVRVVDALEALPAAAGAAAR